MLTRPEQQELELGYAFPDAAVESATAQHNGNRLIIPCGEDIPVSQDATSVDMLKSVVNEWNPRALPTGIRYAFRGKEFDGCPYPWTGW